MIQLMDSRREQLETAMLGAKQELPLLVGLENGQPVVIGTTDDRGIYVYATVVGDKLDLPVPKAVDMFLLSAFGIGLIVGTCSLCMLVRTWLARVVLIVAMLALTVVAIAIGDVYVASCAAMGVFPLIVLCIRRRVPSGLLFVIAAAA